MSTHFKRREKQISICGRNLCSFCVKETSRKSVFLFKKELNAQRTPGTLLGKLRKMATNLKKSLNKLQALETCRVLGRCHFWSSRYRLNNYFHLNLEIIIPKSFQLLTFEYRERKSKTARGARFYVLQPKCTRKSVLQQHNVMCLSFVFCYLLRLARFFFSDFNAFDWFIYFWTTYIIFL